MRAAAGATYSTATLELNMLETDRLATAAHNPVLYEQVKAGVSDQNGPHF